ncbi:MAG: lmo0937 family membrane protein [Flavobacteriales bacterium]
MKKTIPFCVIFLAISVFLSSCGSSLSITKRQHTKGYFVSYSKKHSVSTNKEESVNKNELAGVENIKEPQVPSNFTEANTSLVPDVNTNSKKNEKEESVIGLTEPNSLAKEKIELSGFLKTAKSTVKQTLSPMENRNRGEGYSLLWVVIIVLLILWALGLIGGFGSTGLLHLLLVIALILLILWLLRVI